MKYSLIKGITPHYVEFDLRSAGGKKFKDTTISTEYFEIAGDHFDLYHALTLVPNKYKYILKLIKKLSSLGNSFADLGISLELRDQDGHCRLYCIKSDSSKGFKEIVNRSFNSRDWAQIEEILLSAGLKIINKSEVREITYRIIKLQASYVISINNGNTVLRVEAPDMNKLIKALAIVGVSVDKLDIKDHKVVSTV